MRAPPAAAPITQQVVKNITQDKDFSIARKAKEILRAMKVEKNYSKEQILEVYLNTISLGNNTAGVQAAANLYYGKDVSELTTAECASIISITQNPTRYDPFTNYDNLVDRTQTCLYMMYEQGYLTEEEYNEAAACQLTIADASGSSDQVNTYTSWSWFTEQVISDVMEDLQSELGYTEEEAYDLLYNSGLRIYTTCDVEMQNYLESAFNVDTNPNIFPAVINETYPEGAFVILGLTARSRPSPAPTAPRPAPGCSTGPGTRCATPAPPSSPSHPIRWRWKMTSSTTRRWWRIPPSPSPKTAPSASGRSTSTAATWATSPSMWRCAAPPTPFRSSSSRSSPRR